MRNANSKLLALLIGAWKELLNLKGTRISTKALELTIIITAVFSFVPNSSAFKMAVSASASGSYHYKFYVNEDGSTNVMVNYISSGSGSSWIFVPKSSFSNWSRTFSGNINIISENKSTEEVTGVDYYFYQVFEFSYSGSSTMEIKFNVSAGALIIEPRGIFFSPQIGFKKGESGQAEVYLPNDYKIEDRNKALALGSRSYTPSSFNSSFACFNLCENLIRLQIEFSTKKEPDPIELNQSIFTFKTVRRYGGYGSEILKFFGSVYSNLTALFNVSLTSVNATFFIPDFNEFLSVGGYVPLEKSGITTPFEEIGDIHINIFFIRAAKGVIEIIALHELIHHFLLQAGISPSSLLWFHEGIAQYVSIEVVDALGYEGADTERDRLEDACSQLISSIGERFPFLQNWSPESQTEDVGAYYAASYYVVSRLAEEYGGLDYYKRFFDTMEGTRIEDNNILAYHLSLAANKSVAKKLRDWGFNVADIFISSFLIEEAKSALDGLSPIFQPFKFIAEQFYKLGLISLEKGDVETGNLCLRIAIFIAKWAPLLTFITVVVISAAIIYAFQRKRMPKPEVPTTFEPII